MGEKGEGINKYKSVAPEQSRGCKVQDREYNPPITMCGIRWVQDLVGRSHSYIMANHLAVYP